MRLNKVVADYALKYYTTTICRDDKPVSIGDERCILCGNTGRIPLAERKLVIGGALKPTMVECICPTGQKIR